MITRLVGGLRLAALARSLGWGGSHRVTLRVERCLGGESRWTIRNLTEQGALPLVTDGAFFYVLPNHIGVDLDATRALVAAEAWHVSLGGSAPPAWEAP